MPWEWLRGTVRTPSSVDTYLEVSKSIILDIKTKLHVKKFEKINKALDVVRDS